MGNFFDCIRSSWLPVATLDFVYGNFAWTGFDYKGETGLGWPDVSSHYGIHDLAGFAKDGVGYYNAWWREDTKCDTISISPNQWTDPVPVNSDITVHVTTCAASVALFVNGVQQETATSDKLTEMPRFGVLNWTVPFQPGNITAVGYDVKNTAIATQTIMTAGSGLRLALGVDSPYGSHRNASIVAADGQDTALLSVELLDANDVVVPNADVNVSFTITGPATVVGVANGDPSDHSPDKATWRKTFHGKARIIVASSKIGIEGIVTITATVVDTLSSSSSSSSPSTSSPVVLSIKPSTVAITTVAPIKV